MLSPNAFMDFFFFQRSVLYVTRIYNCITGSDGLESHFHVEMNFKNLEIAARMLYQNNLMQLRNKNLKINV